MPAWLVTTISLKPTFGDTQQSCGDVGEDAELFDAEDVAGVFVEVPSRSRKTARERDERFEAESWCRA